MKKKLILFLCTLIFAAACTHDLTDAFSLDEQLASALNGASHTGSYEYFRMPSSIDYPNIPHQEPTNPITAAKAELGKLLFFETGIALRPKYSLSEGTYSCATCHVPEHGFLPGRTQAIADGGWGFADGRQRLNTYAEEELDAQGTRPLTVLNTAYVTNMFWNGRFGATGVNLGTEDVWHLDTLLVVNFLGFEGLEAQHIEALDIHRMDITDKVLDDYGYRPYFDAAFPDWSEEHRYSRDAASFALSAYVRTLMTNEAPFQKWLKGDHGALTAQQKRGALVFVGKANCINCHNSPSFNSMTFHAIGTKDLHETGAFFTDSQDERNFGRGAFSKKAEDMFKFKVPQLYNLKDYTHFFHGSSKTTIEEVVDFKIAATSENNVVSDDILSPLFQPLTLTEQERLDLIAFLRDGLHDANVQRYVPDEVLSGNCFPNNDPVSRLVIGCD